MTKICALVAGFYPKMQDLITDSITKSFTRETLAQIGKHYARFDAGFAAWMGKQTIEVETIMVPGCLELPLALKLAAKSEKYDAFIAAGCVILGETDHYQYVCDISMNQIAKITLKEEIAVGNAILTVRNKEQAFDRLVPITADNTGQILDGTGKVKNKILESAAAALYMRYRMGEKS